MVEENERPPIPPTTRRNLLLFIPFWRSRDLFRSGLYTKLLVRFDFFNNNQTSISKFHKLKLKTENCCS